MGIFDRFRIRSNVSVRYITAGDVMGLSVSELYEQQPALRAVTSFIADNVAQLPIKSYIRVDDNDRQRDTTSRLATLIDHPNYHDTNYELVRDTVMDYLLYGNALWYIVADLNAPAGYVIERIPWAWVTGTKTVDGFTISEFDVRNPHLSGATVTINSDDCIVFGQYSAEGSSTASSPVLALKQVLAEQVAAWRYRNGVWKNGGQVSSYITRPAGAEWTPEQRDRFARSWKARFSGNGTDTGGTPLLEDGMRIESMTMNAREAEWSEATKLARGDVAAVYNVNPALIWHETSMTYASVKDNARALYSDTLAPIVDMLQTRLNAFLVPRLHVDERTYLEFDFSVKTSASYEEQLSSFYSAAGGAFLTVDEVRSKLNMPAIPGGDRLRLPLNTALVDDDGIEDYTDDAEKSSDHVEVKAAPVEVKSEPEIQAVQEISAAIRKFAKRQKKRVMSEMDKAKSKGIKADGDYPVWWDSERWDRELAEDLAPIFIAASIRKAKQTMRELDLSGYDSERTVAYLEAMAKGRARAINNVTVRNLQKDVTPESVFDNLIENRADVSGRSFATAVAAFAVIETVTQCASPSRVSKARKTWVVTSGNPRSSHAEMDGETVGLKETFSNGLMTPCDKFGTAEETCNCQCQLIITI